MAHQINPEICRIMELAHTPICLPQMVNADLLGVHRPPQPTCHLPKPLGLASEDLRPYLPTLMDQRLTLMDQRLWEEVVSCLDNVISPSLPPRQRR